MSTLDHGFIISRRIFTSSLWFIRYTTVFLWILEIYIIFLHLYHAMFTGCCLHSGTTILPLLAKKWRMHFAIWCTITSWRKYYAGATLNLPCNSLTKCAMLKQIRRLLELFPMILSPGVYDHWQKYLLDRRKICMKCDVHWRY